MKSSTRLTLITAAIVVPVVAALVFGLRRDANAVSPSTTSRHSPSQSRGLLSDPNYFPIAVWLQSPENAEKYKKAGVNLYVGLWQGPTETQLAQLKAAGMPVICEQNAAGLAHKADKTIVGWMHGDEPDNAQPVKDPLTGQESWGDHIPPARIVADYAKLRAADPTRPILLNLGQGVANDEWIGRGSNARFDDYLTYVKGGDIISFDVYPVADFKDGANRLWYVPKGIDRLKKWTEGKKRIWNCIEASGINNQNTMITPAQLKAEVWMSLVHGSTGLIYFVHQFKPTFNEHALLDDPVLLPAVTAINRQIQELAPVLNSPTRAGIATVNAASDQAPIDIMAKRHRGATYVFAVGMRNTPTRGSFPVRGLRKTAVAEVLGEGRTVTIRNGRFEDDFRPHEVHLYRISEK
jgi:hypothetical protein